MSVKLAPPSRVCHTVLPAAKPSSVVAKRTAASGPGEPGRYFHVAPPSSERAPPSAPPTHACTLLGAPHPEAPAPHAATTVAATRIRIIGPQCIHFRHAIARAARFPLPPTTVP